MPPHAAYLSNGLDDGNKRRKVRIVDTLTASIAFTPRHSSIATRELRSLADHLAPGATPVRCNGQSLDLGKVAAVARYRRTPDLDASTTESLSEGFESLQARLAKGEVIYGVNTLFGGSADLRTKETVKLQNALIRELHYGILPEIESRNDSLTQWDLSLEGPPELNVIPYTWARACILIRINSLVKGSSGIRPNIVERLTDLLKHDIIPIIPLRGSISASGDLSPLSYIAGAIQGKRTIRVFSKTRPKLSAAHALAEADLEPISLGPKEGLAIVNGTAISCAAASLALHDAHGLAVLAQAVTAMSVEALRGTAESFDPLFSKVRPHPGQIESARNILQFLHGSKLSLTNEGEGSSLRQDRYSIRTAPQWIGPVLEDFVLAHQQIVIECNSTTDNPLVSEDGSFLHGGNFQAKAVTSAMEKVRQGLHTLGRMLYVQCTEMINPATNRGLPPNLVAEDPSISFIFKGSDINAASLLSELGFLTAPMNHVQSAEMSNQSLNSLALIAARYTHTALDVLSQLFAVHLVALCQAFDLRAHQLEFQARYQSDFKSMIQSSLPSLDSSQCTALDEYAWDVLLKSFDETASLDTHPRFIAIGKALRGAVLDHEPTTTLVNLADVNALVTNLSASLEEAWIAHREAYLSVEGACDASPYLGLAAAKIYQFIRRDLGVPLLHTKRLETPRAPEKIAHLDETGEEPATVGYYTGVVYRAVKDGSLAAVAVALLRDEEEC